MNWLKSQLGVIVAAVILGGGAVAGFARLDARQQQICISVRELQAEKADKDQVMRELDQIHAALLRIEAKVNGIQPLPRSD